MIRQFILYTFSLLMISLIGCGMFDFAGGTGTEAESTISGIVTDSTNTPIANAAIFIRKKQDLPPIDSSLINPEGTTDSTGQFSINVPNDSGSYVIEILKIENGIVLAQLNEFTITNPNTSKELGEIEITETQNLYGSVGDINNTLPVYAGVPGTFHITDVDSAGNFVLENLIPGEHDIHIYTEQEEVIPPLQLSTGPVDTITQNPPNDTSVIINLNMLIVPGGCFMMGSPGTDSDAQSDELPQHNVCLDSFYLEKKEVSQSEFKECIDSGFCTELQTGKDCDSISMLSDDHPVACVSWYQAKSYCSWKGFRLPTEAEWEFSARAGTTTPYYGDETQEEICSYAQVNDPTCSVYGPRPVGSLSANPWGIHDLLGNMMEWTEDWFEEGYYATSPQNNPMGPATGNFKSVRGGRWNNLKIDARSANRHRYVPTAQFDWIGFRCADNY